MLILEEGGAKDTKLYMTRSFTPGGKSSLELSFTGAKVPGNFSPVGAKVPRMELSLQGAKVP